MTCPVPGSGPNPSPLALVGEAPGETEALYGRPFIGEAGHELDRILKQAGLCRKEIYVTNTFKSRPEDNNIKLFFAGRDDDVCLDLPPYTKGKYLRSALRAEFQSLLPELVGVGARVVVALGGTALWALLGLQGITAYAGTVHAPTRTRPFYILPTFHPAAILRNWSLRTTMVANLLKVPELLEAAAKGPAKPTSTGGPSGLFVKVNPTLDEIDAFAARAAQADPIAIDIETAHSQIRTISFSIARNRAFVVPFWEPPANSHWPDVPSEARAWRAVSRILASPGTKIFHNGAYDLQYLTRVHGIKVLGPIEDTMLAHHALEPELPKSLGHLASVYLDLPEWKSLNFKSEKENK